VLPIHWPLSTTVADRILASRTILSSEVLEFLTADSKVFEKNFVQYFVCVSL
jgi:hypothetical protein